MSQLITHRPTFYVGKIGCNDLKCSRNFPYDGKCRGYHCPVCHKVLSSTALICCTTSPISIPISVRKESINNFLPFP